jgi:hypothetical protein
VVRTQSRPSGLRDTGAQVRATAPHTPTLADELAKRLNPFAGVKAPTQGAVGAKP